MYEESKIKYLSGFYLGYGLNINFTLYQKTA